MLTALRGFRFDSEGMRQLAHMALQDIIHESVAVETGKTFKPAGDDDQPEMALPAAIVARVAGVEAALVDDLQMQRLQILRDNA